MEMEKYDKMILAVLQDDDYRDAVHELNKHGFYVTVLNSSGGFLKKHSVTIMIGLSSEHLDEALALLKQHGERTETRYEPSVMGANVSALSISSMPIPVHCGGVILFVLDITRAERY